MREKTLGGSEMEKLVRKVKDGEGESAAQECPGNTLFVWASS